jgi:hypothetical protein
MTNSEFDDPNYKPTYEVVLANLISLNKSGNPNEAFRIILYLLNTKYNTQTVEGNSIFSFGYLINKYKEYIIYTNAINANKDPKYIKDENKLKSIDAWLNTAGYNNFYEIPKDNMDNYLLSSLSIDTLKQKLEVFKERYYTHIQKNTNESNDKPEKTTTKGFIGIREVDDNDLF